MIVTVIALAASLYVIFLSRRIWLQLRQARWDNENGTIGTYSYRWADTQQKFLAFSGCLFVFTTAISNGLLGVLILFSPEPWYPLYAARGLAPLQDQQIAGALMWIPPGAIYLGAALMILRRSVLSGETSETPGQRRRHWKRQAAGDSRRLPASEPEVGRETQ